MRIFQCPFHRLHGALHHLVFGHAKFVFHVNLAGRDKRMDTAIFLGMFHRRANRLTGASYVVLAGAGKRTDLGFGDQTSDGMNRVEITWASSGKTCLDHIYTQFLQLACNADLLFLGHGGARALFAVAQGGIKNNNLVSHVCS